MLVGALRFFHRFQRQVVGVQREEGMGGRQGAVMALGEQGEGGVVEVERLLDGLRLAPGIAVRVKRVGETVLFLVGLRIGVERAAQQRQRDHFAEGLVAVFAVVQQAQAVVGLRDIHPLVRRHLEFRFLEGVVAVATALDVAVGDVVGGGARGDIGMEPHLEQFLLLVPIHPGFEIHPLARRASSTMRCTSRELKKLRDTWITERNGPSSTTSTVAPERSNSTLV